MICHAIAWISIHEIVYISATEEYAQHKFICQDYSCISLNKAREGLNNFRVNNIHAMAVEFPRGNTSLYKEEEITPGCT